MSNCVETGTAVHYLYYQAIEAARRIEMTDEERSEQLVSRVYGNIHLEQPALTKELVRELVQKSRLEGKAHAAATR